MMKIAMISLMVLGVAGAGIAAYADGEQPVAPAAQEQQTTQESTDAEMLYGLVKQARADLREMRLAAGLSARTAAPQAGQPAIRERREGAGEHGGREGRGEGRGEHGGSEEGGAYMPKMTKQNELFGNGARLVLQFNPRTQVFAGSVTNTTSRTLSQVRVEVHLDNGTELGPTKRIDVAPGQTVPVELGAFGNDFNAWISHPEAGVEAGHGAGGEEGGERAGGHGGREGRGEGRGEHGGGEGGGEGARPLGAAYRPVFNQLQILRGEMRAFEADLRARSR
ncbi:MAG: hypothetical protein F4139_09920 [Gemmatimonadetes bacterium]|nr:hypothetical protein [Gemmatimonadota bacterium]MYH53251.1 hypothetical protein [Gemmatimonadota bacterium]MYK66881.1 hypothetical protein [Gemmatimonadota bacterium]